MGVPGNGPGDPEKGQKDREGKGGPEGQKGPVYKGEKRGGGARGPKGGLLGKNKDPKIPQKWAKFGGQKWSKLGVKNDQIWTKNGGGQNGQIEVPGVRRCNSWLYTASNMAILTKKDPKWRAQNGHF